MVYIGVDLHRKVSQVAAVQANGDVLWNRRIRSRPEEFAEIVGDLPVSPAGVAFEATHGWGWFADLLADLGLPAHMSHPKGTKAISSARVKNDAVDAETLAQLLRTNLLPEAWIAPPVCREARRLVRTRAALVRLRSRFKCQLLALLAEHGVQVPEVADPFGKEGRRFIQTVALTEQSQFCVTNSSPSSKRIRASVGCGRFQGSGFTPRPWCWPRSGTCSASRARSSSVHGRA